MGDRSGGGEGGYSMWRAKLSFLFYFLFSLLLIHFQKNINKKE
jgi:hypothetical protein